MDFVAGCPKSRQLWELINLVFENVTAEDWYHLLM